MGSINKTADASHLSFLFPALSLKLRLAQFRKQKMPLTGLFCFAGKGNDISNQFKKDLDAIYVFYATYVKR
jgi:hypothetical protein